MPSSLASIDNMIANCQTYGSMIRSFRLNIPAIQATATVATGGLQAGRCPYNWTIPSMGSGCAGGYMTRFHAISGAAMTTNMICLEYLLGSINCATNTFTDGVSMPTKTVFGSSVQTASAMTFAVIRTALTGLSVVTTTFTDQGGTGSNTVAITMPGTQINSAFWLEPRMTGNDSGIRDVTNISQTVGTAGIIDIYGTLPLAMSMSSTSGVMAQTETEPLVCPTIISYLIEAGEKLAIYRFGRTTAEEVVGFFNIAPEAT